MITDFQGENGGLEHGNGVNGSSAVDAGFANAPKAIEVNHIVKKYGDFTAVDDVTFAVYEGETFGLLGPNGAGKSTLIRMMTTLLPITSGSARIAGHDWRPRGKLGDDLQALGVG